MDFIRNTVVVYTRFKKYIEIYSVTCWSPTDVLQSLSDIYH